jgi:hypothetical protein
MILKEIRTWEETYMLDQRPLMLESVTLACMIELMVEVLVDLAGGAVLHKQTP